MRQPIQVLIYVYRMRTDGPEYLLLHRIPAEGSFWQGVSGGVEDQETPLEAARRETAEETGLACLEVVDIRRCMFYVPKFKDRCREAFGYVPDMMPQHVFVAEHKGVSAVKFDPTEHNETRWSSFEEAMRLLYWENEKEALRMAGEFIRMGAPFESVQGGG